MEEMPYLITKQFVACVPDLFFSFSLPLAFLNFLPQLQKCHVVLPSKIPFFCFLSLAVAVIRLSVDIKI